METPEDTAWFKSALALLQREGFCVGDHGSRLYLRGQDVVIVGEDLFLQCSSGRYEFKANTGSIYFRGGSTLLPVRLAYDDATEKLQQLVTASRVDAAKDKAHSEGGWVDQAVQFLLGVGYTWTTNSVLTGHNRRVAICYNYHGDRRIIVTGRGVRMVFDAATMGYNTLQEFHNFMRPTTDAT